VARHGHHHHAWTVPLEPNRHGRLGVVTHDATRCRRPYELSNHTRTGDAGSPGRARAVRHERRALAWCTCEHVARAWCCRFCTGYAAPAAGAPGWPSASRALIGLCLLRSVRRFLVRGGRRSWCRRRRLCAGSASWWRAAGRIRTVVPAVRTQRAIQASPTRQARLRGLERSYRHPQNAEQARTGPEVSAGG
jgi:hypothetical protein